jgi:hypothetical protein
MPCYSADTSAHIAAAPVKPPQIALTACTTGPNTEELTLAQALALLLAGRRDC